MPIVRSALVAAAVLGVVTSGAALAETTAPPVANIFQDRRCLEMNPGQLAPAEGVIAPDV